MTNWFVTSLGEVINLDFVTKVVVMDQIAGAKAAEKSFVVFHGVPRQTGGSIKYKFTDWPSLQSEYRRIYQAVKSVEEQPLFPVPVLSSLLTISGTIAGGTAVTLVGTGFLKGMWVQFAGLDAVQVKVVDTQTIMSVTPPHAAGAVDVTICDFLGRKSALVGGYTYV